MERIRIGDACDILNGYAFKSDKYVEKGIRVIRIANVQKGYIEDNAPVFYPLDFSGLEKYMLEEGDLLMSLTGNVGRVALIQRNMLPAALNQRVACLRLRSNRITKGFLFHILNSDLFEQQCVQASNGVAQKNMSTEWLRDYEIPLYSMEEQLKITEILDKTRRIIDLRNYELSVLDDLIKARFVEMFGDAVANPMNWPVKKLKDLSVQINSGNTPKGGSENYVEEGITFFRSQNVWKDRLEMDDIAYIDADTHASMKRSSLKHGDILMTKTGRINTENSSLGRAALYMGEDDMANVNGHVYFIRLKAEVNNKFVLRILVSPEYRDLIRSVCVGGIDKRQLNKEHIEEFPIICPPIDMIDSFVDFCEQIDKSKFHTEENII
ncbi:MAG: restriction endonuclease subunit S [Clostridiales bacterium]|nr:restriction endonuclease subunit S [Clostridiales bacterium]